MSTIVLFVFGVLDFDVNICISFRRIHGSSNYAYHFDIDLNRKRVRSLDLSQMQLIETPVTGCICMHKIQMHVHPFRTFRSADLG